MKGAKKKEQKQKWKDYQNNQLTSFYSFLFFRVCVCVYLCFSIFVDTSISIWCVSDTYLAGDHWNFCLLFRFNNKRIMENYSINIDSLDMRTGTEIFKVFIPIFWFLYFSFLCVLYLFPLAAAFPFDFYFYPFIVFNSFLFLYPIKKILFFP